MNNEMFFVQLGVCFCNVVSGHMKEACRRKVFPSGAPSVLQLHHFIWHHISVVSFNPPAIIDPSIIYPSYIPASVLCESLTLLCYPSTFFPLLLVHYNLIFTTADSSIISIYCSPRHLFHQSFLTNMEPDPFGFLCPNFEPFGAFWLKVNWFRKVGSQLGPWNCRFYLTWSRNQSLLLYRYNAVCFPILS